MPSPKEWFVVDGQYSKKRIGGVGGGVCGFVIFIWLIVLSAKLNSIEKNETGICENSSTNFIKKSKSSVRNF